MFPHIASLMHLFVNRTNPPEMTKQLTDGTDVFICKRKLRANEILYRRLLMFQQWQYTKFSVPLVWFKDLEKEAHGFVLSTLPRSNFTWCQLVSLSQFLYISLVQLQPPFCECPTNISSLLQSFAQSCLISYSLSFSSVSLSPQPQFLFHHTPLCSN